MSQDQCVGAALYYRAPVQHQRLWWWWWGGHKRGGTQQGSGTQQEGGMRGVELSREAALSRGGGMEQAAMDTGTRVPVSPSLCGSNSPPWTFPVTVLPTDQHE